MAQDHKKIVVFGSIVHDLVSYTSRFPKPGESIRGNSFQQGPGGKGANQAVAAALLGAKVSMIGKVGDDIFADFNIASMQKAGVDTSSIERKTGSTTGTATITVSEEGGENSIVVTLGANMEMSPSSAEDAEKVIASGGILLCQAEIPDAATKRALEIARKNGVTTFLNPAPGDPNMDQSMLAFVDIICVNENEAEFITGIAAPNPAEAEKAARAMLEKGPRVAIVTLGPKGCLLAERSEKSSEIVVSLLSSVAVQAVDTTGAGDCFCGSLVALLAAGIPLEEAAGRAVKIASLSVKKKGAQSSYSGYDELISAGLEDLFQGMCIGDHCFI